MNIPFWDYFSDSKVSCVCSRSVGLKFILLELWGLNSSSWLASFLRFASKLKWHILTPHCNIEKTHSKKSSCNDLHIGNVSQKNTWKKLWLEIFPSTVHAEWNCCIRKLLFRSLISSTSNTMNDHPHQENRSINYLELKSIAN